MKTVIIEPVGTPADNAVADRDIKLWTNGISQRVTNQYGPVVLSSDVLVSIDGHVHIVAGDVFDAILMYGST